MSPGFDGSLDERFADDAKELAWALSAVGVKHRRSPMPPQTLVFVLHDRRPLRVVGERSEEHTSELQSLMRISYAVFCLKKKKKPRCQQPNIEQSKKHSTHKQTNEIN